MAMLCDYDASRANYLLGVVNSPDGFIQVIGEISSNWPCQCCSLGVKPLKHLIMTNARSYKNQTDLNLWTKPAKLETNPTLLCIQQYEMYRYIDTGVRYKVDNK